MDIGLKYLINVMIKKKVIQNLEIRQNYFSMSFQSHIRSVSRKKEQRGCGWVRATKEKKEAHWKPRSFREDPGLQKKKKKKALRDTQEVFTIEWGIPYRMMVGSPRGEAG